VRTKKAAAGHPDESRAARGQARFFSQLFYRSSNVTFIAAESQYFGKRGNFAALFST